MDSSPKHKQSCNCSNDSDGESKWASSEVKRKASKDGGGDDDTLIHRVPEPSTRAPFDPVPACMVPRRLFVAQEEEEDAREQDEESLPIHVMRVENDQRRSDDTQRPRLAEAPKLWRARPDPLLQEMDDPDGATQTLSRDNSGEIRLRSFRRTKTPPPLDHLMLPQTPSRLSLGESGNSISPRPLKRDYIQFHEGSSYYADHGRDSMMGALDAGSASWWENHQQGFLVVAYVTLLLTVAGVVEVLASVLLLEDSSLQKASLTITNILHFFVTFFYFHWMKGGTCCWQDHDGDLDHFLTLWDQIQFNNPHTARIRLALRVLPTLLCYVACLKVGFGERPGLCAINIVVWYLTLLSKMPGMTGLVACGMSPSSHPGLTLKDRSLRAKLLPGSSLE
ncbi:Saccharomyces cerevisiae [Seminavis robusta]|uniref:Saccharomyces cerevisiae n=1 Tax=Seminavis robusta TaxID=568900 RepID=A0A9N8DAC6_9STRA|nr:Saccharomyces cerevisiae [Seminavis robusta]|eukprot:Sro33_g021360.1 Saccharomyces cerevisiae (393) ;mRNA; f:60751-61929